MKLFYLCLIYVVVLCIYKCYVDWKVFVGWFFDVVGFVYSDGIYVVVGKERIR